jgi:hypothetical protein
MTQTEKQIILQVINEGDLVDNAGTLKNSLRRADKT